MLASRKIRILVKAVAALAILAVTGAVLSAATDFATEADEPTIQAGELLGPEDFASISDPAERSAAIFTEAAKVFTHPRCSNCHPDGDRPRQGDDRRLHEPFVRRGASGFGATGLECSTCHTSVNFNPAKMPGAPNWHLAPRTMAWHGKTADEICAQLKDPALNGDRTLQEIHDHVTNDPLVAWGWNPGVDREPTPGTQEIFAALIQAWIDDGAVCPAP